MPGNQIGLDGRLGGVGQRAEAGYAALCGGGYFRIECCLVLVARLAQPHREVDETWTNDKALRFNSFFRFYFFNDFSISNVHIANGVLPARRVDDASALDVQVHQLPATMLMTAMRTAMPKVTCGRITECGPSATDESISTPRFIGPGCLTMASRLAAESLSSVRP